MTKNTLARAAVLLHQVTPYKGASVSRKLAGFHNPKHAKPSVCKVTKYPPPPTHQSN